MTLVEVMEALWDFDSLTMTAVESGPMATMGRQSQVVRMTDAIKRKGKRNSVSKDGRPPKTTGKKRQRKQTSSQASYSAPVASVAPATHSNAPTIPATTAGVATRPVDGATVQPLLKFREMFPSKAAENPAAS